MMRATRILLLLMGLLLATACAGSAVSELPGGVSAKKPLVIDRAGKRVIIAAEINGRFFEQTSPHCGIGSVTGTNKDLFLFRTRANQNDFYKALVEIGLKPGHNLTEKSPKTEAVQGERLEVTVTWVGAAKAYPLGQVVVDHSEGKKGFEIRFGGNQKAAAALNTGCITCLTSCYAGITSNARYTLQDMEAGVSRFALNRDLLPPGGTVVAIIYQRHRAQPGGRNRSDRLQGSQAEARS